MEIEKLTNEAYKLLNMLMPSVSIYLLREPALIIFMPSILNLPRGSPGQK